MDFATFEQRAQQEWARIPPAYKAGVDGLLVERTARRHPSRPDVYTLGECVTESYPSDWGGPDTTRSWVLLHYGSFRRLAALDPDFDWEGELWETLTHELQHHLESLAADDALEDVDYAVDENFKRHDGEPFDPLFFRAGTPAGTGRYRVEDETFQEHVYRHRASHVTVEIDGQHWRVTWPAEDADITFITLDELVEAPQLFTLVLVRRTGMRAQLRTILRRAAEPVIIEVQGEARLLDEPHAGG